MGETSVRVASRTDLPSTLLAVLDEWFDTEWPDTPYEWSLPEWYAMATRDNELLGRLGIAERRVQAAESTVHVGGVGGVITAKRWRRRGVATALLRAAADHIRRKIRAELGMLLCRENLIPVYRSAGWHVVSGRVEFEQPGRSAPTVYPGVAMVLPCQASNWPPGRVDLLGLPW